MTHLTFAARDWCYAAIVMSCLSLASCTTAQAPPAAESTAPSPTAAEAGPGEVLVPVPTADSKREFLRVDLDKVTFAPADTVNDVGVMSAVVEGDPAKPGFYIVVNRFPPGVMSRPHFHRDERHGLVIKGRWFTGEGDVVEPDKTVPLGPGSYMRHPAGAHHYDGALDEEVVVAISGYGPSSTTVIDGGARFARVK